VNQPTNLLIWRANRKHHSPEGESRGEVITLTDEHHSQEETAGGADKIREIVEQSNALFLAHLVGLTTDKGDGLSLEELRKAAASFQHYQADRLDDSIETAWRDCVQTASAARWENVRKYHLNRLLVHCFAELFPARGEPVQQGLHLSRRTIPGFLAAVHQMLGDDLYTQFDERAEALVNSFANAQTGIIPWDTVFRNEAGLLIVQDVLIYAARHFSDMAKRRNWMIDIVDSHLPPAGHVMEKVWNFSDAEFHLMMGAVYGPLQQKSATDSGWAELNERYDADSLEMLRILFSGLERDHRNLAAAGLL
jgi:hypothetical protein